jgi:hypothetical protein
LGAWGDRLSVGVFTHRVLQIFVGWVASLQSNRQKVP